MKTGGALAPSAFFLFRVSGTHKSLTDFWRLPNGKGNFRRKKRLVYRNLLGYCREI
jgi:hypothetical protein